MATLKSINPVAVEQAAVSFGEIAERADIVRRLLVEVIEKMGDPEEDIESLVVAGRELAAQIGLVADMGARSLGSSALKGTEAQAWLLPPVWHDLGSATRAEAAQREVSHAHE